MAETALGLFELAVVFGGLLAFGVWELYACAATNAARRGKRKSQIRRSISKLSFKHGLRIPPPARLHKR
jgi:hypothetical protein